VSAGQASPAASGSRPRDPVRALQHALYRAAKADPGRRFHALFDKVYRRDVLQRAWVAVRNNNGAPGIDRTTLAEVEEYGVDRLVDELAAELRGRRYRPVGAQNSATGCDLGFLVRRAGTDRKRQDACSWLYNWSIWSSSGSSAPLL
jgi:hypothetical protein